MFARNRAAASATAPAATPAGIPLSTPQRVMARRMHESKQTIPHYYLQTSVDATAMAAARQAAAPGEIAWDAFFVRAAARALARFERFCCRLDGEHLRPAGTDAIGVAVDHEGELFVIPVAAPAGKTIGQISAEIRQGVGRLRSGDPDARRIRPALMTVTNLGACNVESFTPIINPPEAAILGVGRVAPTPVARADGSIAVEPRCILTLSVDHRIASGKYAGDFLGAIVEEIQRPPEATT
jgi:pyruvate dehydrogenase E2 component (dihydrolipoamide acetyltransferase)